MVDLRLRRLLLRLFELLPKLLHLGARLLRRLLRRILRRLRRRLRRRRRDPSRDLGLTHRRRNRSCCSRQLSGKIGMRLRTLLLRRLRLGTLLLRSSLQLRHLLHRRLYVGRERRERRHLGGRQTASAGAEIRLHETLRRLLRGARVDRSGAELHPQVLQRFASIPESLDACRDLAPLAIEEECIGIPQIPLLASSFCISPSMTPIFEASSTVRTEPHECARA